MQIKINKFKKLQLQGKIKAFADIIFEGALIIKGFKIVEGENELFVGLPSDKGKDGKFYPTIILLTSEIKENITNLLLTEYNKGD